jgi:uncharacterized damage-inducible protein DinB
MMIIEAIKSEYERYKSLAELAVEQVNENDFHKIFGDDGNSIAIIMNHLSGNLKSRFTNFLTEDGEKSWRDRDSEFEELNQSKSFFVKNWNEAFAVLFNELKNLTDKDLNKVVKIRGNELTVADALERSLAHTSYHIGQIVLIAKLFAGTGWKTLSIPKGKSNNYNTIQQKKKSPLKNSRFG